MIQRFPLLIPSCEELNDSAFSIADVFVPAPSGMLCTGFEKNFKKISTHPLTVLTMSVITHIEQEKQRRKTEAARMLEEF